MSDDKPKTKVLANGALYDMETHRIVRGATMTSAQAAIMQAQRQEKRRQIIREAANGAVQRADYREKYGDLAFAAAIAESAMIKATTPDDPKAIEAGRFLLHETGESEDATKESAAVVPELKVILLQIMEGVQKRMAADEVIDVDPAE